MILSAAGPVKPFTKPDGGDILYPRKDRKKEMSPVKPARWIRRSHLFRADEYVCSRCGRRAERPARICPGCGAPMRGAKYDPAWADEAEELELLLGDEDL